MGEGAILALGTGAQCSVGVKGQRPLAGQGRQPLPREVMPASLRTGYCLTLESAGLAAKLPFSKATPAKERRGIIGLNETDKA